MNTWLLRYKPVHLSSASSSQNLELSAARASHLVNRRSLRATQCSSNVEGKFAAAKKVFTENDYVAQKQSQERAEWASSVRTVTGRRNQQIWEPELDPPALLAQIQRFPFRQCGRKSGLLVTDDTLQLSVHGIVQLSEFVSTTEDVVSVVLISPRRPVTVGTVARACSCFEVEDIRIVQPRCEHISRHSKSASKGAQYILYRATSADSVREATQDCDLRVAFTRWVKGSPLPYYDLGALTSHPLIQQLIHAPIPSSTQPSEGHTIASAAASPTQDTSSAVTPTEQAQQHRPVRLALVFGREELGMSDEEVAACDVVCSIPIGRLQESLSVSHCVSLALSSIFQQRLGAITSTLSPGAGNAQRLPGNAVSSQGYVPQQAQHGSNAAVPAGASNRHHDSSMLGTSNSSAAHSSHDGGEAVAARSNVPGVAAAYFVDSPDRLAPGLDVNAGKER